MMDRIKEIINQAAERIARILGSAPVVLLFAGWTAYHNASNWKYVNFISDVAILIGLFILRAEIVQSDRMEEAIKQDLRESAKILKLLKEKK